MTWPPGTSDAQAAPRSFRKAPAGFLPAASWAASARIPFYGPGRAPFGALETGGQAGGFLAIFGQGPWYGFACPCMAVPADSPTLGVKLNPYSAYELSCVPSDEGQTGTAMRG